MRAPNVSTNENSEALPQNVVSGFRIVNTPHIDNSSGSSPTYNGEYWLTGGAHPWWLSRTAQVMAALAAIAGHKWSVFLRFGGGRGVATFFGGLLALCPAAALFGGEILFLGACLTRYASLGSISGAVAAYAILIPLTILNGFPVEYLVYALVGAVFIIIVHRDNISRLLAGTERRIGERVNT